MSKPMIQSKLPAGNSLRCVNAARLSGRGRLQAVLLAALISAAGAGSMGGAHAADLAKGKAKADEVCSACHGKDGNTPIDPSYPRLAGQHEDFLVRALMDYKTDRRKNAIMGVQAKTLSKQDIENLAAYYADLPSQLSLHHR